MSWTFNVDSNWFGNCLKKNTGQLDIQKALLISHAYRLVQSKQKFLHLGG